MGIGILTGLLALFLPGAAAAQAETEKRTLTVLSYNIKGLPPFAAKGYDQDRYADIGRILAQRMKEGAAPDIVLLQESFVDRTRELRKIAGYPYVAEGPRARGLFSLSSGLYILSRHPIVQEDRRAFGSCSDWDCFANKGVQFARIQLPGVPAAVDIYNTHMQASRNRDEIRLRQVKAAADFVRETRGEGTPIIFAGDFNFRFGGPEGSSYSRFLAKTQFHNAAELCLRNGCAPKEDRILHRTVNHHFIASAPEVRLHPVAMTRNFREKVRGRALSDHLGYEATYELRWYPERLGAASPRQPSSKQP
jgi:endonuclease/exonuclease/phosphatase family metal-dependent hydrolase